MFPVLNPLISMEVILIIISYKCHKMIYTIFLMNTEYIYIYIYILHYTDFVVVQVKSDISTNI